jgi:hypothetical protein
VRRAFNDGPQPAPRSLRQIAAASRHGRSKRAEGAMHHADSARDIVEHRPRCQRWLDARRVWPRLAFLAQPWPQVTQVAEPSQPRHLLSAPCGLVALRGTCRCASSAAMTLCSTSVHDWEKRTKSPTLAAMARSTKGNAESGRSSPTIPATTGVNTRRSPRMARDIDACLANRHLLVDDENASPDTQGDQQHAPERSGTGRQEHDKGPGNSDQEPKFGDVGARTRE